MKKKNGFDLSKCIVFFDFDNTLTSFDILDDIIARFSINKNWVNLERAWQSGKIGSLECLRGQLHSIRITKENLLKYLSKIRIDSNFNKLLILLREKGIKSIIVSDSFSFLIKNILKNNGLKGIKVYSNRLRLCGDRLIPIFAHNNKKCGRCAHCKKGHFLANGSKNKKIIYIGDGLSDICPAEHADFVFAKDSLLRHFRKARKKCIAFRSLGGVYRYLKGVADEQ
jgi:2,3-diketo-5-methylthio-1-phosphopentane phosphatase